MGSDHPGRHLDGAGTAGSGIPAVDAAAGLLDFREFFAGGGKPGADVHGFDTGAGGDFLERYTVFTGGLEDFQNGILQFAALRPATLDGGYDAKTVAGGAQGSLTGHGNGIAIQLGVDVGDFAQQSFPAFQEFRDLLEIGRS